YESAGAPPTKQESYVRAVAAALARCAHLPFSKGLGGAIAGRPLHVTFVETRFDRLAEDQSWLMIPKTL
ncbi:MAG TPA: hypothetical protein VHN11_13325, partial [Xanthobacteraceae bacterium]|nr:hypothetical protein [Xanthobacteraceae bacterium]